MNLLKISLTWAFIAGLTISNVQAGTEDYINDWLRSKNCNTFTINGTKIGTLDTIQGALFCGLSALPLYAVCTRAADSFPKGRGLNVVVAAFTMIAGVGIIYQSIQQQKEARH